MPEKVGSGGFRKVSQSQPAVPYEAIDQATPLLCPQKGDPPTDNCRSKEDPIDLRLEEFYNGTGSAIPFQRPEKEGQIKLFHGVARAPLQD